MSERSAPYPLVTIDTAIEFINKVNALNYKLVSYEEVAKLLGLSSTTTKSFTSKISTAKQFGLITTENKTIQLTDVAKNILYPTVPDIRPIEIDCFRQPPLYAKLIDRFDGKALPSKDVLSNILMKEYRITQSAKDSAAQVFLESAESLGLIQGGVLQINLNAEGVVNPNKQDDQSPEYTYRETLNEQSIAHTASSSELDYYTQTVPTVSGKIAEIKVPTDADKDDLFLIQDMLHSIMRRKFHVDPDEG